MRARLHTRCWQCPGLCRGRSLIGGILRPSADAFLKGLSSSSASAASGGCQLKGTASFTPGLNTTSQPFTYSFSGDLTNCKSSDTTAPATGFVQAGGTQGLALITWGDGTRTVEQYDTSGAAAAVKLDGTVIASTTLQPVNPADPPLTVTTTRYAGGTSNGLLAFEATPTECTAGVTTAGIEGAVFLNG